MPASVPNIVASGSYVSQTVALTTTALYTPAADGLFRISVFYEWSAGSINPTFSWTSDLVGANSTNAGQIQASNSFMTVFTVQGKATHALNLAVAIFSSPTWSLYYTIEQLQ